MRNTGEKTINLPHGNLKLRLGRDKIEIADIETFLKTASRNGLMRSVPETLQPDMKAIALRIKTSGEIPPGVAVTAATTKFSYSTINKGEQYNGEQTKVGIATEPTGQAEVVESETVRRQ